MLDNGTKRPPPNYAEIVARRWIENVEEVPSRLKNDDEGIVKRMDTFTTRFGFEKNDVRDEIANSKMFRATFAVDPTKQSIHENAAADWLKQEPTIKNFMTLPKSGKNAYYVTGDGEIRLGKKTNLKSLDFRWISNGYTFYATHKYTREAGGAQDNQYESVKTLLQAFQKGEEKDQKVVLLAIVDGPYYTGEKLKELRRFTRSSYPYSYALPIQDVPEILNKHRS